MGECLLVAKNIIKKGARRLRPLGSFSVHRIGYVRLLCLAVHHYFDRLAALLGGNGFGKLGQGEAVGDNGPKVHLAAVDQRHSPGMGVWVDEGAANRSEERRVGKECRL